MGRSLEIEKAVCLEIGKEVTPYDAREYFFQEGNNRKLNFKCKCGADLVGGNIYVRTKTKVRPYFRLRLGQSHKADCRYRNIDKINSPSQGGGTPKGTKKSPFPTELILTVSPSRPLGGRGTTIADNIKGEDPATGGPKQGARSGETKTSLLELVVSCYVNASPEERLKNYLTINKRRRPYADSFVPVVDFPETQDVIYFGTLDILNTKELPKGGYRIRFKERVFTGGVYVPVTLYVPTSVLLKDARAPEFTDFMQSLHGLRGNERAICYFVGICPELKKINHADVQFEVFDALVRDLRRLVFRVRLIGSR
jgi:hypothetical protein